MCLGALGSQTGGSITRPAAFCGVASCKPSWGRVSVEGVLPLAPSMDHVGVMARCVRDLAMILQPLIEPHGVGGHPRVVPDLVRNPAPVRGPIRLGRLRGPFEDRCDPELWEHLSRMDKILIPPGRTGVDLEIIDIALPAAFADVWTNHRAVMAAE